MSYFCRGHRRFSAKALYQLVCHQPKQTLSIEELTPFLNVWSWLEGTPNEVMSGVVADKSEHRLRVARTSERCPIIVSRFVLSDSKEFYDEIRDNHGKYDILYGVHRLCALAQRGVATVDVYVVGSRELEMAALGATVY